jgi:hypothetical protein
MNECDGIFFINHALKVKTLSVYSAQERFEQTLETLHSIDKHCPSNMKFIFDSSAEEPDAEHIEVLRKRGVNFIYTGAIPDVKEYSAIGSYGSRSIAETIAFIYLLNWFNNQGLVAKRIYKLSGRYKLNDNFIANDDRRTRRDRTAQAKQRRLQHRLAGAGQGEELFGVVLAGERPETGTGAAGENDWDQPHELRDSAGVPKHCIIR